MKQISQFLRLDSLRISQNYVEGDLPELLGIYPDLKLIDFSHNRLRSKSPPPSLRAATQIGLRAGLVGGFTVLAFLSFIFYYSKHRKEAETSNMKSNVASKDIPLREGLSTASVLAKNHILELPDQSPLHHPTNASISQKLQRF
ncbi:hypothetical protein SAY86_022320 [Trapa natans]|uniref:Uncharacterized protein n=1 Tax=Trapa natans TaxID=22666 RepID=A0AAN7R8A6_TRANT|nr:hypothetical protein SAY86_022320 [Trapa natans]